MILKYREVVTLLILITSNLVPLKSDKENRPCLILITVSDGKNLPTCRSIHFRDQWPCKFLRTGKKRSVYMTKVFNCHLDYI